MTVLGAPVPDIAIAGGPVPRPTAELARRPAPVPVPNATLIEREDLTPSIARLVIRPHEPIPTFAAGQYFALGLPVDGRWLQRPYSTASTAPATGSLEFLVRLVPTGALTPRIWRLRPGDELRIGPPKGIFRLVEDDARTHLLVATGTGLAPFLSMARWIRSRPGGHPRVVVVHGVARAEELAYRATLERWSAEDGRIQYVPAISRPTDPANAGWPGRTGRLDRVVAALVEDGAIRVDDVVAYLCGNPAMIEAVGAVLRSAGVADGAVIQEHYWITNPGA